MQRSAITLQRQLTIPSLVLAAGLAAPAAGQCDEAAFFGSSSEGAGVAIDVHGDLGAIGAYLADDGGTNSGAVITLVRSGGGWFESGRLVASDAAVEDRMGTSVAVRGNLLVAGAPNHDGLGSNAGAVYVFRDNGAGWVQEEIVQASDGAANANFGASVDIFGNRIIVGAPGAGSVGAVYVFEDDGTQWTEIYGFTPSDGSPGDQYGRTVSLCANFAAVGAPFDDDGGMDSGSVYAYGLGGVSDGVEYKLLSADLATRDGFGQCVSADGPVLAISAYQDDDSGSSSGSAYIFRFDGIGWAEEAKLTAFDGAAGDRFGFSVSLRGGTVIVGAYQDDDQGSNSGAAYLFSEDGGAWNGAGKLLSSSGGSNERFGWAVATDGDRALVSAISSGSSYLTLGVAGLDCDGNGVSDSCDIAAGAADCNGNGLLDACEAGSDCDGNGVLDSCDIADGTAADCDGNGVPDSCDIASGSAADCNGNGSPDSCDIASGASADCNGNGVPDECEGGDCDGDGMLDACAIANGTVNDCNGNGMPDNCDIASGASADCNANGVPDECEGGDCDGNGVPDSCDIGAGGAADCNGNGIPDSCDIANGSSADCNSNGIPDECDGGCPEPDPDPQPEPEPTCPADLDANGSVGVGDLIKVIVAWGACDRGTPEDLTGNGLVDVHDLIVVLRSWGKCPGEPVARPAPPRSTKKAKRCRAKKRWKKSKRHRSRSRRGR